VEQKTQADSEWAIDNLPNRLTIFRITLIPVIVASLHLAHSGDGWFKAHSLAFGYLAAWTFVIAAITDFFDGYIARTRKLTTIFGSFLDPIADKLLVVSSLIILLELDRIPVLLVIILVVREFYMTSLRLLAIEKGLSVPVSSLGKWKTTTQMIGIPLLMANDTVWFLPMNLVGTIAIYIASFLSIYSALDYSLGILKKFKHKIDAEKLAPLMALKEKIKHKKNRKRLPTESELNSDIETADDE